MQHTFCAGRAIVVSAVLVVDIEEDCGLRGAQMPAAAATDTTHGEISRNATFSSTADGTDLSGHEV